VRQVNLPIAVLIWPMIDPMMLRIDVAALRGVGRRPRGLLVVLFVNWLVKPFSMTFLAWLFFAGLIGPGLADQYVAGTIILAAAPCTAMVFVWSCLTDGDPAYTLVQVALNDLIMLVLIFAFQGEVILGKLSHIVLIAIPLLIQVYFNSGLAYGLARWLRVAHAVAAPGALIGASNFFELAVATASSLFGLTSGATLAAVVGVLVEVPVMLSVCSFCNRTRHWFADVEATAAPASVATAEDAAR
jgi:ACR3 family arsenite efflux pump ArsB